MPEFYIKKGLADVELKNWIELNKDEPFVRVNIEVESSHARLRRSFHVLLTEWFKSGEWSCDGQEIHTIDRFKDYYKYVGCDYTGIGYSYLGEKFLDVYENKVLIKKSLDLLWESYPNPTVKHIKPIPYSWTKMSKAQKSNTLDILLTEIRLSMTNNQKVLSWVAKITHEIGE